MGLRHLGAIALAGLLVACAGDDAATSATTASETTTTTDGATTGAASGTVLFHFTVPNGVRESPGLMSPLLGSVHGAIFKTEDVTLTGPVDGAEEFGSIVVDGVDLQTVDVSAASWTSGPIPPGNYTFLGFFDLNGNGAEQGEPDAGDAATLPSINKFTITADQQLDFVVSFDLVL